MIDLDPGHLAEVRRILAEHAPGCEVRAYGSRVTGGARKFSDLDLALRAPEAIEPRTLRAIKEAFSESNLPILVDVQDWRRLPDTLRVFVEQHGERI